MSGSPSAPRGRSEAPWLLRTSSGQHALQIRVAHAFTERLRGLMFRRSLPDGHGLLITRCASVHTIFMRFPIDIVYFDSDGVVTRCVSSLRPWRASFGGRRAMHALELNAGTVRRLSIRAGDGLQFDLLLPLFAGSSR